MRFPTPAGPLCGSRPWCDCTTTNLRPQKGMLAPRGWLPGGGFPFLRLGLDAENTLGAILRPAEGAVLGKPAWLSQISDALETRMVEPNSTKVSKPMSLYGCAYKCAANPHCSVANAL